MSDTTDDDTMPEPEECPWCDGTGTVNLDNECPNCGSMCVYCGDEECESCQGTGLVPPDFEVINSKTTNEETTTS